MFRQDPPLMMTGPRSTDTTTTHARLLTRRCAGAPPRWRSIPSSGSRGAVGTLSPCFHSAFSLRLDRRSSSPTFDDVSARPRPEDQRSSWTAPCCSSRRRVAVELKARGALATLGRRGAGRQTRLTDFNYIRRSLARAHALYTLELDGTMLLIAPSS